MSILQSNLWRRRGLLGCRVAAIWIVLGGYFQVAGMDSCRKPAVLQEISAEVFVRSTAAQLEGQPLSAAAQKRLGYLLEHAASRLRVQGDADGGLHFSSSDPKLLVAALDFADFYQVSAHTRDWAQDVSRLLKPESERSCSSGQVICLVLVRGSEHAEIAHLAEFLCYAARVVPQACEESRRLPGHNWAGVGEDAVMTGLAQDDKRIRALTAVHFLPALLARRAAARQELWPRFSTATTPDLVYDSADLPGVSANRRWRVRLIWLDKPDPVATLQAYDRMVALKLGAVPTPVFTVVVVAAADLAIDQGAAQKTEPVAAWLPEEESRLMVAVTGASLVNGVSEVEAARRLSRRWSCRVLPEAIFFFDFSDVFGLDNSAPEDLCHEAPGAPKSRAALRLQQRWRRGLLNLDVCHQLFGRAQLLACLGLESAADEYPAAQASENESPSSAQLHHLSQVFVQLCSLSGSMDQEGGLLESSIRALAARATQVVSGGSVNAGSLEASFRRMLDDAVCDFTCQRDTASPLRRDAACHEESLVSIGELLTRRTDLHRGANWDVAEMTERLSQRCQTLKTNLAFVKALQSQVRELQLLVEGPSYRVLGEVDDVGELFARMERDLGGSSDAAIDLERALADQAGVQGCEVEWEHFLQARILLQETVANVAAADGAAARGFCEAVDTAAAVLPQVRRWVLPRTMEWVLSRRFASLFSHLNQGEAEK